jgi:hypothetical protein
MCNDAVQLRTAATRRRNAGDRIGRLGIVRLVISAAEVDDLGVDTPEGDQRGRGVVGGSRAGAVTRIDGRSRSRW